MKESKYFEEIFENLKEQIDKDDLEKIKRVRSHLGIFTEPYLSYMLEGKKTVESRFSKNKISPYGDVSAGDIVFVKKSGGGVVAYFIVQRVLSFDLRQTSIEDIKRRYGDPLCVTDSFWELKKDSNYATLMYVGELVKLKEFKINKKGMQT